MKKVFFLILLMPLIANAQDSPELNKLVGSFRQYYNSQSHDSIYTLLSPRIQQIMTLDKVKVAMSSLRQQAGEMKGYEYVRKDEKATYYLVVFENVRLQLATTMGEGNKLNALRFLPETNATETGKKDEPKPESNIVLKTQTGNIYGTLMMPAGVDKAPVVLIIAGSGPTDRDGNNTGGVTARSYKLLADSLLARGIATVRYDKRGIGESAEALGEEATLRFEDMIDDARGFIKMLKADKRCSQVIVLGHSEGTLVGMVAAEKERADKYISVAGMGERIDIILKSQIALQSAEMAQRAGEIMDSLRAGHEVKKIDQGLEGLFRPSIQPYMRSFLKYDPAAEIKKLKMPVLVVQGTTDIQVETKEATLLGKANPKAKVVIIKGMTHVLKDGPADREGNMAVYSQPDTPLSAGLVPAIANFVLAKK